jgi:ATP-dependent Clp endopeptidase proteolytic subunit ClpP
VFAAGTSLREQARWLDENHDLVIGLFDKMEDRVIGAHGIHVEPQPLDLDGNLHGDFASQLSALWAEWSVRPEVTGMFTRPEAERLLLRSALRDGEVFTQLVRGNVAGLQHATSVPFSLEMLEADFVPYTLNSTTGQQIRQGIIVITAQQFVNECREAGVFEASAIDLHIHSPGGDVMQGFAIYNTLSRLKATMDIWVDGVAASMASMIVCLPGANVHMPENAWIMIHKPWGGIAGDSDEMRDYADFLDRNEALMLNAYMNKTGLGREELEAMLKAETWLSGAEAVEKGFADTLEPELQAAACMNENKLKDYTNMPQQLQSLFTPRAEGKPAAQTPAPQVPAPQAAVTPPAPVQAGNIDISALAVQLQQQMQTANAERVNAVSAVFESFPAFASLRTECISDMSCSAEVARGKLLTALAAGTTPLAGPGAIHLLAGNGNLVGDSVRAAIMSRVGYAEEEKDNAYAGYTLRELARASLVDRGIGIAGQPI